MKKVYLDSLPRYTDGLYNGKINWKSSIGSIINFVNEDIEGQIKILDYNKKNQKVKIQYVDDIIWFYSGSLINSRITRLTKRAKQRKDFKYEIDDVVNEIKILDRFLKQTKRAVVKRYRYKCLKCGHSGEKNEKDVSRTGCPICGGFAHFVDPEINSIKITHPNIYNRIIDDDADKYSYGSGHKVHWKCPFCNGINFSAIKHLTSDKSVGCQYCGDGFSYPEKVLYNVLSFVSDSYEKHKRFEWSDGKQYDAFDSGIFIEIHGSQHYIKSFEKCGGRTLEEERKNDEYKEIIAKRRFDKIIDYIIIKAYPENFETIKGSILNSDMNKYYDLSKVDWDYVKKLSTSSLVYEVSDYFNKNYTVKQIANIFDIDKGTISRYLKRGTSLGLCDYNPTEYKYNITSKKVKCKNTGEIFRSETEAAKWCGLKSSVGISRCARNISSHKTAGTHPITKERLMWEFI